MAVYDVHLELNEDVSFEAMPESLQVQLLDISAEWPSFPALCTKTFSGKKVVHARIQLDQLTEQKLQSLFDAFGLDWIILGIREGYKILATYDDEGEDLVSSYYNVIKPIDKATILPFLADIEDGVDGEGNPTMRPPILSDTLFLSMYSGTEAIKL